MGPQRLLAATARFSEGQGGLPVAILLLAQSLKSLSIQVDVLSRSGLWKDVGALARLPSESEAGSAATTGVELREFDALLSVGAWNPRALPLTLAARRASLPVIYVPKGSLCRIEFTRFRDLKKIPYLLTIEALLAAISDTVVCASELEKSHLVLPLAGKATVIPEPFELRSRARAKTPPRSFVIGILAEYSPRKGLAELVEAFSIWWHDAGKPAATLRVGGNVRPGSERYIGRVFLRIQQLGIQEQVEWVGPVYRDDRETFFSTLQALIVPSRFESFGLTVLEGLNRGLAVLVSSDVGVLEFLPTTPAIRRVHAGDAASIANGISYMYLEASRAADAVPAALEHAQKRLSPSAVAREYQRLLEQIARV